MCLTISATIFGSLRWESTGARVARVDVRGARRLFLHAFPPRCVEHPYPRASQTTNVAPQRAQTPRPDRRYLEALPPSLSLGSSLERVLMRACTRCHRASLTILNAST